MGNRILAGVGKADITAEPGTIIGELLTEKAKRHIPKELLDKRIEIDDPLFVKALVLDDGASKLALITMDVTAVGGRTTSQNILDDTRIGKKVWHGHIFRDVEGCDPTRIVFKVVERTIDRKGQVFLVPEIEVETYWTSLTDKPETIIGLYHAHGTSEQLHSELKSDMDVERLPSGKFLTNSFVLRNAMLALNEP